MDGSRPRKEICERLSRMRRITGMGQEIVCREKNIPFRRLHSWVPRWLAYSLTETNLILTGNLGEAIIQASNYKTSPVSTCSLFFEFFVRLKASTPFLCRITIGRELFVIHISSINFILQMRIGIIVCYWGQFRSLGAKFDSFQSFDKFFSFS